MQQAELAVGEVGHGLADASLPTGNVERENAGLEDCALLHDLRAAELNARASEQLVERERLGEKVHSAEFKASELGRYVASRRQNQHRKLGSATVQLAQDVQAVASGQQQVEDHDFVAAAERPRQPLLAVLNDVDVEAFGLERPGEKRADPYLVLHHQYAHQSAPLAGGAP